MALSLLTTALVMGLAGGPHCTVMCAAPCHAVSQGHAKAAPLVDQRRQAPAKFQWRALQFHAGRTVGYGLLGAVAATAMEQVAWFADRTSALHPVWVGMHLAILAWGLCMVLQAQQPAWLERAGRMLWSKAQPVFSWRAGAWVAGMAWALMPCGLLYSAILVAALSGSAQAGAASMVSFALGSALWLIAAPYAWRWLGQRIGHWRSGWGVRAAGGMLVAVALWALWLDLVYKPSQWCR